MIVSYTLPEKRELTPEQIQEIEEACRRPIIYDDDCPDMTPETEIQWKKAVAERNARLAAKKQAGA